MYLLKLDALPVFIDVMFTCPHELRINVMMCIINTLSCFKKNPVELSPLLLPHVQAGEHSELLLLFEELKESQKASGTRSCSLFWSLFSCVCLFVCFFFLLAYPRLSFRLLSFSFLVAKVRKRAAELLETWRELASYSLDSNSSGNDATK